MDASNILGKVKEGATRKLGPLPAWAWGVVAAGGIWIYRGFTGKVGGGGSSSSSGSSTDVGGAGFATYPTLSGGGAPPPTPGFGSPEGSQSSLYVSNEGITIEGDSASVLTTWDKWLAAIRAPVTTGGGSGAAAPKTSTPPAKAVATPKPAPKPTPAPVPAPKPARYYTVVKGDTLTKIGAKYGKSWPVIYNANKAIIGSNPDLIRPGQRLLIPY